MLPRFLVQIVSRFSLSGTSVAVGDFKSPGEDFHAKHHEDCKSCCSLVSTVAAVECSVGSCADLMAVDETSLTSLLIVTSSPIECEDYLRFVVRNNMTLTATVPEVVLSNIALKIKGGLTVEIEPDIVFKDVFEVVSFCDIELYIYIYIYASVVSF